MPDLTATIQCPKCSREWEGDESDALFGRVTCPCGQLFRVDEVTMYRSVALTERWITRDGHFIGTRHRTRAAAEKAARARKWPRIQRVAIESDVCFFELETVEMSS